MRVTKISANPTLPRFLARAEASEPTQKAEAASVPAIAPAVQPAAAKTMVLPGNPPPIVTAKTASRDVVTTTHNKIIIPRMRVNTTILEGSTESVLNKGLWRIPGTSNPAVGGNMVIAGHRYKWLPPSNKTFWDIDKLKVGDMIEVNWEGKRYLYRVSTISIVTPDRVDILNNTAESKLTLFTCTPKFSSKYRYVVEATPYH